MPKYYGVATKGNKIFEGFVNFDIPVERMMAIFHSYNISVDFYTNCVNQSQKVELGLQEEGESELCNQNSLN